MRQAVLRLIVLVLFFSATAFLAFADAILFNDGSVIVVEKAWVDGDFVKYKTSRGTQSVPKSNVREIQEQAPAPTAGPKIWGFGVEVGSAARTAPKTRSGSSNEAVKRLRENLNANPADGQARLELIRALNSVASLEIAQGDLSGAAGSLEEALDLDKKNVAIMSNLAIVHLEMGNYRAAEELLQTCLEIDRSRQQIYWLLGQAFYAQEKIDEAINQWTAGLQLGPNPEMAKMLDKARQEQRVHNGLGVLQGAHFIVRYDRNVSDRQLGQEILTTLERLYDQLSRQLTSKAPATIAVIIYPDQAYFDITRASSWTSALFDGKIRIPTKGLTTVTPELQKILIHELTHAFISSLPGRGCPAWFNEGVAQLEEGRSAANYRKTFVQLRDAHRLPSLQNLQETFVGLPEEAADVAYAESLSAVEYLVARGGRTAVRSIIDLMAQNYNFENAFKTAMQRTVAEFDAAWQRDLSSQN